MKSTGTSATGSLGITLLRVSLGVMWVSHAMLKVLVYTLPGTATFFESVGIPGFMAYPVFGMEIIGGLALILGIYARQVSLGLIPIMAVAAWVHFPNGWLHTNSGGGWEYPVFLTITSFCLWLLGDGAYAIRQSDRLTLRH